MAEGTAERVCEGGDSGCRDTAGGREPEVRVAGWGRENEGLSEPDEDLAKCREWEGWRGGSCACIADPIAEQDEHGGDDDCKTRTAGVECPDCGRSSDEEGEEEAGTEPVGYAGACGEESGRCIGDGGVGEPLRLR